MSDWDVVGAVFEGEPIDLDGLNPWEFKWSRVDTTPIEMPHPQYASETHRIWIYEIEADGKRVRFAAGELSPNVWGFYVPVP
jgi:hypothetical protein